MADLPKPTKLEVSPLHMLLVLAPLAVFVGAQLFLASYADTDFVFPDVTLREDGAVDELIGRYKFFAALFFYGAISISVALFFVVDTGGRHTWVSICWALGGVVLIIATVYGMLLLWPGRLGGLSNWDLLGRNVFDETIGKYHISVCADGGQLHDCEKVSAFGGMVRLLKTIDILAALGASGAILGTIMTLSHPADRPDMSTDEGRAALARNVIGARDAARRYVYCSGLMLTTGMTVLLAWMYWPSALIADEAARESYVALVGALSLFVGVGYSLLIMSYYAPVTLILATRVYALRHATPDRDDSGSGSGDGGGGERPLVAMPTLPEIGQLDGLKAMIAIISPILASAIGTFGNTIVFD